MPFFFLLHNLEEQLSIISFVNSIISKVTLFSSNWFLPITQKQFNIAITLLTVVFFICSLIGMKANRKGVLFLLFLQGTLFFNSLQHVLISVIFLEYTPGVASALLLILPSTIYGFILVIRDKIVDNKQLGTVLTVSLFLYPVLTIVFLIIGKFLSIWLY